MRSITTILDFRRTEVQPQIFCTVRPTQFCYVILPRVIAYPASEVLLRGLAPASASDTLNVHINGALDSVMGPVVGLEERTVSQKGGSS